MGKPYINGLDKDEIISFYKFICNYEEISDIAKDKELKELYPNIAVSFKKLLTKKMLNETKNGEIHMSEKKDILSFTRRYNNKKKYTQINSIFYHLRNSIAHGNLTYKDKYYTIIDYSKNKELSAYGIIHANIVKSIIKLIEK